MTKQKLDTDLSKKTEAEKPQTQPPQRKVTPATFAADEKSKENSRIQVGETAAVENHYVNGSFTHKNSNRGK
ncbi:hypothetical protein SHI21_14635 [Bacteriovorax sp. PP10]|uniref:Uncharacterized protein n=1 Tax=Bacteriovorax antarcticus TaxID=3088717 RepID=A0ABU5VWL4_9BACT|nr:hypothetical protein [Bacteriovorax sp. PP10]MEA9357461.1 hypothetical protein [Bacteriovorax sp. PP10]